MALRKITLVDIDNILNNKNSVHKKIQGEIKFPLEEAKIIHKTFFSDIDFLELFEKEVQK